MSEEMYEIGLDEFESLYEEAESLLEQATSFAQIGKFHSFTTAHIWSQETGMLEVSADEWRKHQGFKFLNLHACIDTQEFNAGLEKGYERRVQVKAQPWNRKGSDGNYTRIPSDWEAIFEPSLLTVTGKKTATEALKALEGKYVQALDVKQQPTKRQPEPEYNTCKLVKIYESREAAYADFLQISGGAKDDAQAVSQEKTYSDDIINSVKLLSEKMNVATIATSLDITEQDVKNILGDN